MKNNYLDLRKLNPSQLFSLRKKVIRLRKSNRSMDSICAATSLNERQINKIWAAYSKAGEDIEKLRPRSCGRKKKSGMLLTENESRSIQAILTESTPEQYQLGQFLWTRECIIQLVQKVYGKHIPPRSLTNYLKQWKLSFPATLLPQGVPKEEYRALQRRAKAETAVLYRLYASNISQMERCEMIQEGWSVRVLFVPAEKQRDALYAIPSKGVVRFLIVGDRSKPTRQINFLRRLLADTSNDKCILILDNFRLHDGKRMTQFLAKNSRRLEIIETLSIP